MNPKRKPHLAVTLLLVALWVVIAGRGFRASAPTISCDAIPPASLPRVILFGASWCGYCEEIRRLFAKRRVDYCEYDVESSPEGQRRWHRLGGQVVPVLLIGSHRLDGYDEAAIEALLRQGGYLNTAKAGS